MYNKLGTFVNFDMVQTICYASQSFKDVTMCPEYQQFLLIPSNHWTRFSSTQVFKPNLLEMSWSITLKATGWWFPLCGQFMVTLPHVLSCWCSIFCMIVHHVIDTRQKKKCVIQSKRQSVNRQQSERDNTDQILHGPWNRSWTSDQRI